MILFVESFIALTTVIMSFRGKPGKLTATSVIESESKEKGGN